MKKHYDGLEAVKIPLARMNTIFGSQCEAMIQLRMENGICVSPDYQQQIEYVGDEGPASLFFIIA